MQSLITINNTRQTSVGLKTLLSMNINNMQWFITWLSTGTRAWLHRRVACQSFCAGFPGDRRYAINCTHKDNWCGYDILSIAICVDRGAKSRDLLVSQLWQILGGHEEAATSYTLVSADHFYVDPVLVHLRVLLHHLGLLQVRRAEKKIPFARNSD